MYVYPVWRNSLITILVSHDALNSVSSFQTLEPPNCSLPSPLLPFSLFSFHMELSTGDTLPYRTSLPPSIPSLCSLIVCKQIVLLVFTHTFFFLTYHRSAVRVMQYISRSLYVRCMSLQKLNYYFTIDQLHFIIVTTYHSHNINIKMII